VTRLLDGRHHLERFAMEQAGEVDYLITLLAGIDASATQPRLTFSRISSAVAVPTNGLTIDSRSGPVPRYPAKAV